MRHQYPLPLHHSWPLFERARHFDLGWVDRQGIRPPVDLRIGAAGESEAMTHAGVGVWHCDLRGNRLTWSPTVYDLFGIPLGAKVSREDAVALYCEGSRAAMERLRAHAIEHRRGFTLDVEIGPARAQTRWIRLIAAPECDGETVVGLHGFKCMLRHEP